MKFGISQSIPRKEDDPLLRGAGRYVADVAPAGVLHAAVRTLAGLGVRGVRIGSMRGYSAEQVMFLRAVAEGLGS